MRVASLLIGFLLAACGRWGFAAEPDRTFALDGSANGSSYGSADAGLSNQLGQDGSCSRVQRVLTISADRDDGEINARIDSAQKDWLVQGEPVSYGGFPGIHMGFWNGAPTWGYFRFTASESLPVDRQDFSAHLELWGIGTEGWNSGSYYLLVRVETVADAKQVAAAGDAPDAPSGHRAVSSAVRWPEPSGGLSFAAASWNATPELSPILRERAQVAGAISTGTRLQFWVSSDGYGSAGTQSEVSAEDWSSDPAHAARLVIEWCQ